MTEVEWEDNSLQKFGALIKVYERENGVKKMIGVYIWDERDDPKGSKETNIHPY